MAKLSTTEPDFETPEDAAAYDRWFRAKVQAALDSTEPDVPHEEVMASIREIIDRKKNGATRLAG
ncbi:type II toxin-antitoxin system RelB family antitoxin [Sphingomonas sp. PAMC 26617]|uniref:type II toxin-antitoxin system RelB family antitoxin n=1 Tax=Sphingomonas sp. PAMC 26617 TaxID=1112216 RepID=UPI00028835AE|nr:hypothetical protein [Sphingomonas sp. PAMC 26617]